MRLLTALPLLSLDRQARRKDEFVTTKKYFSQGHEIVIADTTVTIDKFVYNKRDLRFETNSGPFIGNGADLSKLTPTQRFVIHNGTTILTIPASEQELINALIG